MRYFAQLTASYTAKNRTHAEIAKFAQSVNGTLINSDKKLGKFIATFKDKIKEINAAHPRAKDIELDGFNDSINNSSILYISGNFQLTIFPVINEIN